MRADSIGIEIGIKDVHGREIRNGDKIRVQHVNYLGTEREKVDEEFAARVFYNSFQAMYQYLKENSGPDDEAFVFNHRSSRFEVV